MTELKDNSFSFPANVKQIVQDKNGAKAVLTIDELDFLEVNTQLGKTAGYDVEVKITPAQSELDTNQEANGQTELEAGD